MRRQIVLLILVAAASRVAFGDVLTWTLLNATFNDGATATGFFVLDADTNTISNWDISASGGTVLFPFEFTPSDSFSIFDPSVFGALFDSNQLFPTPYNINEVLSLRIPTVSPLTDAGGTISIDLTNLYQGECLNCVPYRSFISGSVTTTPEPLSAGLLGTVLLLLVLTKRLLFPPNKRLRGATSAGNK